jgi:hypothetical protein
MSGGAVAISWGAYGGWYGFSHLGVLRLCAGWLSITYLPYDLDDLMSAAADRPITRRSRT